MKHYQLADMSVSRIALGCMTLGGSWDRSPLDEKLIPRARAIVETALELGINFFDHANIYCAGKSEEIFGRVLADSPSLRDKMILQTKCGIRFRGDPSPSDPPRFDFSYENITQSAEASLKRLGIDRLDILLLHRPDPLVEPAEVARAFDQLHQSGKVRAFGVSNHTPGQIELLRRTVRQPLVVNQLELNLLHNQMIDIGIMANQDRATYTSSDCILVYCRLYIIMVQAWAPTGHGRLAHPPVDGTDRERRIGAAVAKLAEAKHTSPDAIVTGWLLRHPAGILPVIGTANPVHLRANAEADGIELSREEWWTLLAEARGGSVP